MRLLYEKSISYRGYLIIPFQFATTLRLGEQPLYSYVLLSELGSEGQLHQAENPGGLCTDSPEEIVAIAQKYLDTHIPLQTDRSGIRLKIDYFQNRYTYRDNLIIIFGVGGKYFYDHYPPDRPHNIAAPKLFTSEQDCMDWIKDGMDAIHVTRKWSDNPD